MKKWKIEYTFYKKGKFAKSFMLTHGVSEDAVLNGAMQSVYNEMSQLNQLGGVFKIEIDQITEVTNG